MYQLRPYQQQAVEAVIDHFRRRSSPAVVVLPTGAGKSLVIAELARLARGRVLVLAHVKELVEQNGAKFTAYGREAGIFSAGMKRKEAGQQVTFASIQSLARNLEHFREPISLVIIDECHRVNEDDSGQYRQVIGHLEQNSPALKVLGLTATPYRLGSGWIYQRHYHGYQRTSEPRFFSDCVFELPLRYMIRHNYLVPPRWIDGAIANYDFSALAANTVGEYALSELDSYLGGAGRVTRQIINQVLEQSRDRQGVMIFAATVNHAQEILGYLPDNEAALITGDTPGPERDALIRRFKARRLKFLVNVAVLTTGFDAPHVDFIAILRPTASVSLYQQIVGRGLRLAPGKQECLIIDYAGNRYDLYAPEVGSPKPAPDTEPVQVLCPACGFANTFWGRTDGDGRVTEHFGRKCRGLLDDGEQQEACDYRFRFKECPACNAENDIAARQCHQCGSVLVDPDQQLRQALKLSDALVLRCAGMTFSEARSAKGVRLKVIYHDEDGGELHEWFAFDTLAQRRAFGRHFARLHLRCPERAADDYRLEQVLAEREAFRAPDFVIGRKAGRHWQVHDKLFDYHGRFRRANELS